MAEMGTIATTLPKQYTVRAPGREDIPAILELMAASAVASDGEVDPWTEEDILNDWRGISLATDAWLVVADEDTTVGYMALFLQGLEHGRIQSDGYAHPAHVRRGIGTTLLRLAEARARELVDSAPDGARVTLDGGLTLADKAAPALFEHEGFVPVRYFWQMRIDMEAPPPAPQWPAGIAGQICERGRDERVFFDTLEEAFLDHWGHTPRDYGEWYARNVESESYDPSLWWLATAENGEPAGAIRCRMRPDGTGFVNTLGVRRPWRKHGLGRALLLQSFCEFYRRGVTAVALGVDAQNPTGATHVYERAGMRVRQRYAVYRKELRPGMDLVEQTES